MERTQKKRACVLLRTQTLLKMAATYSPAGVQYHRRGRGSTLCSEWEEVEPRRYNHRKYFLNIQQLVDSIFSYLRIT